MQHGNRTFAEPCTHVDEWVNKSAFHEGEVRHELVAVHDDVGVAENDDHLLSDQQDQDQPGMNAIS